MTNQPASPRTMIAHQVASEGKEQELRPCPFCGYALPIDEGLCAVDVDEFGDKLPPERVRYTGICCSNCSAFVPGHHEGRAEAIAAWNRRSSSDEAEVDWRTAKLPCDVSLPPATVITAGCTVETLLTGLRARGMVPTPPIQGGCDMKRWETRALIGLVCVAALVVAYYLGWLGK